MARFDVYANPDSHAKTAPCLPDVPSPRGVPEGRGGKWAKVNGH